MSDTPSYITGKKLDERFGGFISFFGPGTAGPEQHTAHLPGMNFSGAGVFVCRSEDWQSPHARWYPATPTTHAVRFISDTLGGCLNYLNGLQGAGEASFTLSKPLHLKGADFTVGGIVIEENPFHAKLTEHGGEKALWASDISCDDCRELLASVTETLADLTEKQRLQNARDGLTEHPAPVREVRQYELPSPLARMANKVAMIEEGEAKGLWKAESFRPDPNQDDDEPEETEPGTIDYTDFYKREDSATVDTIAAHGRGQEIRHLVRSKEMVMGRSGEWGEYALYRHELYGTHECRSADDEAWAHVNGSPSTLAFTGQQLRKTLINLDYGNGDLIPESGWTLSVKEALVPDSDDFERFACTTEEEAVVAAKGHAGWLHLWERTGTEGHALDLLKIADAALDADETKSNAAYTAAGNWANGNAAADDDLEVALHQSLIYSISREVPDDYMEVVADHINPKVRKVLAESGIVADAYEVSKTHRRLVSELARDDNPEVAEAARESLKRFGIGGPKV